MIGRSGNLNGFQVLTTGFLFGNIDKNYFIYSFHSHRLKYDTHKLIPAIECYYHKTLILMEDLTIITIMSVQIYLISILQLTSSLEDGTLEQFDEGCAETFHKTC